MAGTLEINERERWMPAGWIFDNTLALVSNELRSEDPDLASLFIEGTTDASGGFLSLQSFTVEQLGSVLTALRAVSRRVVDEGPSAFHDPAFYPGFLGQLDDLIAMIQRDGRIRRESDRGAR